MDNNPGPAVFNNTNPTTTVSAGHSSKNRPKHTLVNGAKQCTVFCNYVHLFIVKIYNQIEDAVLRICLLDRAYKVPQDINSVQKSVFGVYYYNEVTPN